MHLGNLALSGASMLVIEATGVRADGRITPGCTGLYSDENEAAMKRTVDFVRSISPVRIGIQLRMRDERRRRSVRGKAADRSPRTRGRGKRLLRRRSRLPPDGRRRGRSTVSAWTRYVTHSSQRQSVPRASDSTSSRCIRLTATCCASSCRHSPTAGRTSTGGSLENRMRFPLEVMRRRARRLARRETAGRQDLGNRFRRRRLDAGRRGCLRVSAQAVAGSTT